MTRVRPFLFHDDVCFLEFLRLCIGNVRFFLHFVFCTCFNSFFYLFDSVIKFKMKILVFSLITRVRRPDRQTDRQTDKRQNSLKKKLPFPQKI